MSISTENWIIGDTARLTLNLTDANGIAVEPQSLVLKIKPPVGAPLTINAPTKVANGLYQHDLALSQKGHWYYRWESTAPIPAIAEGAITVSPSRFV